MLPNPNVVKAFLDRYIELRLSKWSLKNPADITEETIKNNPKLQVVTQLLQDIKQIESLETVTCEHWFELHFKLYQYFNKERQSSGFWGYFVDPLLCHHLRYMMSYINDMIGRTSTDIKRAVQSVKETVDDSASDKMKHLDLLEKNLCKSGDWDTCFEMDYHLRYFSSYRLNITDSFEDFIRKNVTYCEHLNKLYLQSQPKIGKSKSEDEDKDEAQYQLPEPVSYSSSSSSSSSSISSSNSSSSSNFSYSSNSSSSSSSSSSCSYRSSPVFKSTPTSSVSTTGYLMKTPLNTRQNTSPSPSQSSSTPSSSPTSPKQLLSRSPWQAPVNASQQPFQENDTYHYQGLVL